jgi:hypothetical protein
MTQIEGTRPKFVRIAEEGPDHHDNTFTTVNVCHFLHDFSGDLRWVDPNFPLKRVDQSGRPIKTDQKQLTKKPLCPLTI